jgi:Integrase core domain
MLGVADPKVRARRQSCLADRDSAGPYRASRPVRCAPDPRGLARPGVYGEPWPRRSPHASPRHPSNNAAAIPGMHHRQPTRFADRPQPARPEIRRRAAQSGLARRHHLRANQGRWLYLAVVLDLFTRKIIGWAMRDHMRAELTIAALTMAIQRQKPSPGPQTGMPPGTTCSPTSKDTTIVSGSIPLSGISPPNRQNAKPLNPVSTKSGEGQRYNRPDLWTAPTCEGLLCSLAPRSPAGIYPVFSTLMESATRRPNI